MGFNSSFIRLTPNSSNLTEITHIQDLLSCQEMGEGLLDTFAQEQGELHSVGFISA